MQPSLAPVSPVSQPASLLGRRCSMRRPPGRAAPASTEGVDGGIAGATGAGRQQEHREQRGASGQIAPPLMPFAGGR
jgi:hypothetical protein